ncbi:hypothetical protein HQQ94_08280 [Shewanella sp. VB17]|uniref:PapB/FocB family fimbrial expression transcriptional regulator n=1 Tax=Shewanella sp. VB17 TaxID=2739432 RepID=UPI0015645997|nr:PapB/FocB family fimbrial expression transcriptional regulator [Shewanella sp. VB17]NRD73239.1 hypothetical protein [Shewanella sp. VB17]
MKNRSKTKVILFPGHETVSGIDALINMTRITSEAKINALKAHLVDGLPAKHAYWRHHVDQQHFSEALRKLNRAAELALKYSEAHK